MVSEVKELWTLVNGSRVYCDSPRSSLCELYHPWRFDTGGAAFCYRNSQASAGARAERTMAGVLINDDYPRLANQ